MSPPTSSAFWSLMDRWRVPDEQALELVGYDGKLPETGKRPRFRLDPDQERIVATLQEIDQSLAAACISLEWLRTPLPAARRTPLDLIRAGALQEVLATLTRAALEASLRRKR